VKLKEKSTYNFRVIRLITLPDDSKCWVLTHDGDDRYLLPAEYYAEYPIREEMALKCRVDKINCTGRIFLEPEHPWYREGEKYLFTYLREELQKDRVGNDLKKLIFKGIHDDIRHYVTLVKPGSFVCGDKVEVIVRRIRKGHIDFMPALAGEDLLMREGGIYVFTVTGLREDGTLEIRGPGEFATILDAEHYHHHNLTVGETFRGVFLKWMQEGYPLIEPEHPVYQPGKVFPFRVLREEGAEHGTGDQQVVMVVEDCFGNEIRVFAGGGSAAGSIPYGTIQCRVERLKRGRPVLRIG
jgi:hypothetical protein